MASDYLPSNDTLFHTWFDNFMSYLTAHVEALGLSEAEIADLVDKFPVWSTKYMTFMTARATYRGKRDEKNAFRKDTEAAIRPIVSRIQSYAGTTDDDRQALGIPVRNGEQSIPQTIGVVNNKPQAIIDMSQRLIHVLRIQNESQTGTSKAKPKGVKYAEIWIKKGGEPSEEGFEFYGTSSRNPVEINYQYGDGNMPVHYRLRWVDGKGRKSAWSEIETATIAA